jgi:hypothetical protein
MSETPNNLPPSPSLTEVEISALLQEPGHGIMVAHQHIFEDIDEFKDQSNNFYLHFGLKESFIVSIYQRQRPYLRLQLLYPEIYEAAISAKDTFTRDDNGYWQALYVAYDRMAQLVDVGDPWVSQDGVVDEWHLCR